jgi:hypothetical protein
MCSQDLQDDENEPEAESSRSRRHSGVVFSLGVWVMLDFFLRISMLLFASTYRRRKHSNTLGGKSATKSGFRFPVSWVSAIWHPASCVLQNSAMPSVINRVQRLQPTQGNLRYASALHGRSLKSLGTGSSISITTAARSCRLDSNEPDAIIPGADQPLKASELAEKSLMGRSPMRMHTWVVQNTSICRWFVHKPRYPALTGLGLMQDSRLAA